MFPKELKLIKQVHQKNVCFVIIGILKMLDLNLNYICNKCHVLMTGYKVKNIAILNVKGADFRCILWGISRDEAVNRLNNSLLEDKISSTKKSWNEFDQLKDIDQKFYCSDYYDVSVNKYGIKCRTLLRFWGNKG